MGLTLERDISWVEIWDRWRQDEEEVWRNYYQEKGFSDWERWRSKTIGKDKPNDWDWKLFSISEPLEEVSKMFVGPFPGWRHFYKDRNHARFADIVRSPTFLGSQTHDKILSLLEKFPEEVRLVGARYNDEILIIEGTHRSAALAYAFNNKIDVKTNLSIALVEFTEKQWIRQSNPYATFFFSIQTPRKDSYQVHL